MHSFRAHWYRLLCCKASVTPAQLEYLVFFNQKHEMNSSDFFRAHWYRLLCCKASVTPARVFFHQNQEVNSSDSSTDLSSIYYIEGTFVTLSPTLVDPAFMSVVRAVDGQETGLSVQPAEKKNRLQTGQEFIYRVHWSRLLSF